MAIKQMDRLAPLSGALAAVLFTIGFFVFGETPAIDATAEAVMSYYENDTKIFSGVLALIIIGVLLVIFAGLLRARLLAGGREWLASVVFAGGVIYAVGIGIIAAGQAALAEASNAGAAEAARALNILDNNSFPVMWLGLSTILLATAWHTLSTRSLPVWIGWMSLALGVLSLLGPIGWVAFLLFPLWLLAVSITMFLRPVELDRALPQRATAGG